MTNLQNILASLRHPRLLVLGDWILDQYTWGDAERVSPEAPVLILRVDTREVRLGGAASVAMLLRGLDAGVTLAGVIGDDPEGRTLQSLLKDERIDTSQLMIVDKDRPTTTKERFVGRAANRHPHQILRVDEESRTPIDSDAEERLATAIASQLEEFDAVLISDYGKGVCTPRLVQMVIAYATDRGVPVIIDPARIPDYDRYRYATLLKPNRVEAELASGMSIRTPADALVAAAKLRQQLQVEAVLITLDRDGMVLVDGNDDGQHFPTQPRTVYDITGAGDMVLAALGLCVASGASLPESVQVANIAAGLEVQKLGVAPITRAELSRALPPLVRGGQGGSLGLPASANSANDNRITNDQRGGQGGSLCMQADSDDTRDALVGCVEPLLGEDAPSLDAARTARVPERPSGGQGGLGEMPDSLEENSNVPRDRRLSLRERTSFRGAKDDDRPSPSSIFDPPSSTKITDITSLLPVLASYRSAGQRITFTNGCFDLLHVGHVTMLEQAAALGDILIVAINNDASVRRLKGPGRPVIPERDRARTLAALDCVDHVLIFDDLTPHSLLKAIRPDILAKGGTTPEIIGHEIVELYGGQAIRLGEVPGISTTVLLETLPPFARGGQGGSLSLPASPNEADDTRITNDPRSGQGQSLRLPTSPNEASDDRIPSNPKSHFQGE